MINGIFRKSSEPIRYAVYLTWIQLSVFILFLFFFNLFNFLKLFFLITTMSQYVYRFCILCRNGIISTKIVATLIFVQVFLNSFHAFLLAWSEYPRPYEALKMKELVKKLGEETGITDIVFISFVNAVRKFYLKYIF
jgi:hypothetical protein